MGKRKPFRRGKPEFSIENPDGKFWVIETYRTGEWQVHNPLATAGEAEALVTELQAAGGSLS